MGLRVRVRMGYSGKNPRPTSVGGYQFRPVSFFASVGAHILVILALALLPAYHAGPDSKRPVYDELIRPEKMTRP